MGEKFGDIEQDEVDDFYQAVSANVKKIRTSRNMSQLELSLKLGIRSIAFYSNCENLRYGKHFNLEHIYRLAKALEVDMCVLLEDVPQNNEQK